MSHKQIQRIKTALSDGSCVSVNIDHSATFTQSPLIIFADNQGMYLSSRGLLESEIISVKYNRPTYADLGAGDIVNAPNSHYGDGVINGIDGVSHEPFQVIHFVSGAVEYYERQELILLEKAND